MHIIPYHFDLDTYLTSGQNHTTKNGGQPQKKVTNERASEFDYYIAFRFPAVIINKPQQKMIQSMSMLWSVGN
jgi:hypothetical protein